jgi:hypothetical protein
MSVLAESVVDSEDISEFVTVFSYTNNTTRELTVLSQLEVGSFSKPIAGNGNYELKILIDDVELLPNSLVRAATQPYVGFQSRHISLHVNQVLTVKLKGQPSDTDVHIETILNDVTPVLVSDLAGVGLIPIDHNYGGTDNYRVMSSDGSSVQDATITAYLASDYAAGNRSVSYIRGRTTTNVSGRWRSPLMLDADDYKLVVAKPSGYQTSVVDLTVSNA